MLLISFLSNVSLPVCCGLISITTMMNRKTEALIMASFVFPSLSTSLGFGGWDIHSKAPLSVAHVDGYHRGHHNQRERGRVSLSSSRFEDNSQKISTSEIMTSDTATKLADIFNNPPPSFEVGGSTDATRILDSYNILGECILFDDLRNEVVWTDIDGKQFHRLSLDTSKHSIIELPKMLCAFALRPKGEDGYVFAWEDGFQLYDVDQGKELSDMSEGEDVNPSKLPTRLNDGRVDPTGKHFICGGHYGDVKDMYMKVYKCTFRGDNENGEQKKLVHEAIVDKIQTTNSICWSNDGQTMFLADSPTRTIFKHDYDQENGTLSNERPLRTLDIGVPDGSCVDSNGNVWNALWRNGAGPSKVQCFDSSTGEILYTINMPDSTSQVTCCCFGGPDLDILFISTAHIHRDRQKEPYGGCVYAAKVGVKGCLEKRFCGV